STKGMAMRALLGTLLLIGLILLVIGLVFKALKWLIIIAVVVWLFGLVRGVLAKRSGQL
ncbi:MAG: hypothetical protein QOJ32_74, partial [Frankiaceae bacterium]|nr:hypothetical protein [Frankiaceae bacterium]